MLNEKQVQSNVSGSKKRAKKTDVFASVCRDDP